MNAIFFKRVECPACERPCEEASRCPWCGADVAASRGTVARLLALALACALPFLPLPAGPGAALVAATAAAVALAAPTQGRRHILAMAVAAMAVCALCHALPGEMAALGGALRRHLRWIAPALALAAMASGAARLPPLPADGVTGRLAQALKTPAILALGAVALVGAAWGPASPGSCVAAALCAAAALACAREPARIVAAGVAALLAAAFVAPIGEGATRVPPCGVFAAAVAALGLVQILAGMKRTGSEPSSQP